MSLLEKTIVICTMSLSLSLSLSGFFFVYPFQFSSHIVDPSDDCHRQLASYSQRGRASSASPRSAVCSTAMAPPLPRSVSSTRFVVHTLIINTLPTYLKIACAFLIKMLTPKMPTFLPICIDASNTDPLGAAVFSFGRGAMHPSLSGCRHSLGLCVCVAGGRRGGVCADGHSE